MTCSEVRDLTSIIIIQCTCTVMCVCECMVECENVLFSADEMGEVNVAIVLNIVGW